MFALNVAPFDWFSLAHALMPFLIARRLASIEGLPGSWGPLFVVLMLIAICEPAEAAIAWLGLRYFDESTANIAADVALGLASGALGLARGRAEVRRLVLRAERNAAARGGASRGPR